MSATKRRIESITPFPSLSHPGSPLPDVLHSSNDCTRLSRKGPIAFTACICSERGGEARDIFFSSTFDDVSQLDRDISTALAGIREWRNSFVPINRIPLDVLSLISTHLSSQADRLRATSVCRHWRKTFLQHGALWSRLILKNDEVYAKTLLERAKGSALDVVVDHDSIATAGLLSPYTRQIKSTHFERVPWKCVERFLEINSGPLPLLRKLSLEVVDGYSISLPSHPNTTTPPSRPLFTDAVNVKEFTLHSNKLPYL